MRKSKNKKHHGMTKSFAQTVMFLKIKRINSFLSWPIFNFPVFLRLWGNTLCEGKSMWQISLMWLINSALGATVL